MNERFGFIHDKLDIKILILFILQRLCAPINMDTLAELTLCDDGISYFDFAECVAELVKTGHICEEENQYSITEKGKTNSKITETGLPYSVRMKAEKSTYALAEQQKRAANIKTSYENRKGGCMVKLSMEDGLGPILSMELLAGSEEQAAQIQRNFKKNAEGIYGKIIGLLLTDSSQTK